MRITEKLQEQFPFISVIVHGEKEYVGIVINQDANVTSFYDYEAIESESAKQYFLEPDIDVFKPYIRNFTTKDVKITLGPVTSLNNIIVKRIKRRSITLVRKPSST